MEIERGTDSGLSVTPWSQVTPTIQEAGRPSTAPQADSPGNRVKVGLERAGAYVKDAVDKTREKVAGYRDGGIEQASQDIVEYARSQPKTALLIASGVGLVVGMLLTLGRRWDASD
jgi:ElaB/YqjD/DUF883 family membrane-anchored ribosome-binding protein